MTVPSCRSKYMLDSCQQRLVGELYAKLYGAHSSDIDMPSICWKYTSVTIRGKVLGCHNNHSHSSSVVSALWRNDLFGHPLSSIVEDLVSTDQMVRPARINSFRLHRLQIHDENITFLLVTLSWFKFHPGMLRLGKPLTIWCSTVFEIDGIYSIVPIQLIQSRTISLISDLNNEPVLIMCPCINF